jgi:hypothetical protein
VGGWEGGGYFPTAPWVLRSFHNLESGRGGRREGELHLGLRCVAHRRHLWEGGLRVVVLVTSQS